MPLATLASTEEQEPPTNKTMTTTTTTTTNATTTRLSLEFADFIDLQTRLLLLPRVEEEGIGAVILSYQQDQETAVDDSLHPNEHQNEPVQSLSSSSSTSSATCQSQAQQHTAEPSKEYRDDVQLVKSGSAVVNVKEVNATNTDNTSKPSSPEIKMTGCVLVGIGKGNAKGDAKGDAKVVPSVDDNEDLFTTDFTDILANIRQQPCPIVLYFEPPAQQQQPPQQQQEALAEPNEVLGGSMSALSAWGSRMRAQSEKYAKEAAHGAASLSTAVAVAATEAKERATKAQQQQLQQHKDPKDKECCMFLQSSSGAFFPVSAQKEKVTTSSLLVIRKSPTEPCLSRGFSFQWYRSMTPGGTNANVTNCHPNNSDDSVSMASTSGGSGGSIGGDWVLLIGATYSAFQPDATLVGRRLRCIVTIQEHDDNSSNDSLEDTSDLDSVDDPPTQTVVCEFPNPLLVSADLTLLNGARQALARGAKFGGLMGRGNASGRTFRVEVALAVSNSKNTRNRRSKQQVLSSLNICQVSNNTCESLNGDACPILQASAVADPANPKRFDLILPMDSVAPDSMLSALMTDGKFQLEAPNRLTRESFLLSLGIANYKGRPADLNATTILFREDPVLMMLDDHDDFGSINSGSSCSTYSTPSKASSSLAGSVEPTTPDSATSLRSIESVQTKTTTAQDRIAEMEEEMQFLRAKLTRKDKVVSELQRQITRSDTVFQKTKQSLSTTQQELKQCKQEGAHEILSLKTAQANVIRLQGEQSMRMSTFETKILTQTEKITELEKANRNLQNEKAVLAAAVEARDSKLGKMGELQGSFEKLSEQVAQTDVLRMELFNSNQKYADVQKELERVSLFEKQLQQDLDQTKASGEKLTTRLDEEELKTVSSQEQLASLQKKNQLLKAERNNFKQKNDSLSKEISKLCRNGRTIKEIEKMIGDHEARAHEVEELRKQKRKALEDVHMYRTSYEQSKVAQQLAGVDYETRKALERNAEMERLLLDLTEYVTAQEMQVETLKQVNDALQAEIHSLAQASLNKNEV